jgi:hypothetical protein
VVVDDIKKDAQTHSYKWTMQLAADILVESTSDKGNGIYDVILKESSGNRRLLVRMLNQNDYRTGTPPAGIDTTWYVTGDGKSYKGDRLVCESNAVSPDFKVMLWPFIAGEQLPVTTWNTEKSQINIGWNDELTTLGFNTTSGLTKVSLLYTDLPNNAVTKKLSVVPNPAKNSIVLKNIDNSTVTLYDIAGKEVMKKQCTADENTINVSALANACYLVKAADGTTEKNTKLLINR